MFRGLVLPLSCLLIAVGASRASAQDKDGKVRIAELSPKAEAAIEKGLAYLAKNQNKDGSWDQQYPHAVTALSLMAFMVKGHSPEHEPYGETMSKAVDYLVKQVMEGGKGKVGRNLTNMYEHGLVTLALSEVWGESSRSDEIRDAIKKAVGVIVKSQSARGGWRYYPDGRDQDISVTVMQIVALASAKEAGILVPDETIKNAIRFVKSCQNDGNGGFGYQGPSGTGFARSAAGVTSLLMCGERNSKDVARGLEYLHDLGDGVFEPGSQWFFYGHYYAVQAMYQASEKDYKKWYPKIRDTLVSSQAADGSWEGGIRNAQNGYCTPMGILILGVPYRFLPIYQR